MVTLSKLGDQSSARILKIFLKGKGAKQLNQATILVNTPQLMTDLERSSSSF